jgi:hypothetical protein
MISPHVKRWYTTHEGKDVKIVDSVNSVKVHKESVNLDSSIGWALDQQSKDPNQGLVCLCFWFK